MTIDAQPRNATDRLGHKANAVNNIFLFFHGRLLVDCRGTYHFSAEVRIFFLPRCISFSVEVRIFILLPSFIIFICYCASRTIVYRRPASLSLVAPFFSCLLSAVAPLAVALLLLAVGPSFY